MAEQSAPEAAGNTWQIGAVFNTGDTCKYEGKTYQCRQGHTVHAPDWIPPNTPNLWTEIESNEWRQHETYNVGDTCTFGGQTYQCLQAHTAHAGNWTPPNTPNLWSPQ